MLVPSLCTIHLSPETTTLGLVWSPSLGTRERVSSLCKTISVVAAFLVKERLPQSAVWPGGKMGGSLQATITAVCENKHQATLFFPPLGTNQLDHNPLHSPPRCALCSFSLIKIHFFFFLPFLSLRNPTISCLTGTSQHLVNV